jgi:hypothetical protein
MDERFFVYFPFLALALVWLDIAGWRQGVPKALVFIGTVIVCMVPWQVRNYQVYQKPVILTVRTSGLVDKFIGPRPTRPRRNAKIDFTGAPAQVDSILSGAKKYGMSKRELIMFKKAVQNKCVITPYSSSRKMYEDFKEFWRPIRLKTEYAMFGYIFEKKWSLIHNLSEGITYGLLLPFFILGAFYLLVRRHKYGIFFLAIILIHTLIHVVLAFAVNRYRIPVDAFIIVVAFYGMQQTYRAVSCKLKWNL